MNGVIRARRRVARLQDLVSASTQMSQLPTDAAVAKRFNSGARKIGTPCLGD
jgi:hypothetical protein